MSTQWDGISEFSRLRSMLRVNSSGSLRSPFYWGRRVLNETDHLLLHVHRLGLESKCHFVDQRLDAFAVCGAAQRLSLNAQGQTRVWKNNTADTTHRPFKVVLSLETPFHLHRRSWGCCEILRCWRSSGCTKSPDLPHSCPPDVFEELKTHGHPFSVPSAVENSHSTF